MSSSSHSNCPVLPSINPSNMNSTSQQQAQNAFANLMQVNSNSPPIYDTRYLYLIDCRPNRKKFEKSRIHTAIHYTDVLNDSVYLSPPVDNYTLVVLYDDDGTFLTSSAPATTNSNSHHQQHTSNGKQNSFHRSNHQSTSGATTAQATTTPSIVMTSDEIIASLKTKINCSPSKTIYILSGGFEQFHAKFPFMCSSQEIRSTTDRHKYLTIYPNCVIENQIYIGSGIQVNTCFF